MYSRAISLGYAVPDGNFAASVHSVFQSALNLRLNGENGLLTLVTSNEADLPQGIRVDTPEGFSFEEFQAGEPAVCRNEILHFENRSLTVQVRGARRWKCDLPALKFDSTNLAVSAAWRSVWYALNERQRQTGSEIIAEDILLHICHCEKRSGEAISSLSLDEKSHQNRRLLRDVRSQRHHPTAQSNVSRKVGNAMRDLVHATRQYELAEASALRALIGLGAGLTPSGDDLLVGYLAGLWCTVRDRSERVQFISGLGNAIIRLSAETNDISRTYLYHAARGQVSSRLANLAEAIAHGEHTERLLDIAEAAMRVGHTSGMETVTGMLIGLTVWEDNPL